MSTAKTGDLEIQIEELVREHVAALRRAATAAVERAFGRAAGRKVKAGGARSAAREAGRRRAPEEVAALGERLYGNHSVNGVSSRRLRLCYARQLHVVPGRATPEA